MALPLIETSTVEAAIFPQDLNGSAVTGDYVSMANYSRCEIVLQCGAWSGGTSAVTLQQALTAAGGSAKSLSFTKRYTQVGQSGTGFAEEAVSSSTFDLDTANETVVIDVQAEDLDVDNGFYFINVNTADPSNSCFLSAHYRLHGARHGSAVPLPDAKV